MRLKTEPLVNCELGLYFQGDIIIIILLLLLLLLLPLIIIINKIIIIMTIRGQFIKRRK